MTAGAARSREGFALSLHGYFCFMATVVKLEGLESFQAKLQSRVNSGLSTCAVVYRSYLHERFDRLSQGGGEWPDLAERTKRARRQGKKKKPKKPSLKNIKSRAKRKARMQKWREKLAAWRKNRKFTVLRDTGTLMNVLSPTFTGAPGAVQDFSPFAVTVGFGGNERHGKGSATVADIAGYHQRGSGKLPKRRIIVGPDATTIATMGKVLKDAIGS